MDGFLLDPDFPKHIPLVRFVDDSLSREMAQYALLHVLMQHRTAKLLRGRAGRGQMAARRMLPRATADARVGILGLGEIGTACCRTVARPWAFSVTGWSRSRKSVQTA